MHNLPINFTEVESNLLAGYGYADNTLTVQFKAGKTYNYNDVPESVYTDMNAAESKGSFFLKQVKGVYDYAIMGDVPQHVVTTTHVDDDDLSAQLILIEKMAPEDVFVPGGAQPIIDAVRDIRLAHSHLTADTEQGRNEIRTIAAKIGKIKSGVVRIGDDYARKVKAVANEMDSERKRAKDLLQAEQDLSRQLLTDYEEADKKRRSDHMECIGAIADLGVDVHLDSADEIQARLTKLGELHMGREFQEFDAQVNTVRLEVCKLLQESLAIKQKSDADAKQLAELQSAEAVRLQTEREDNIRAEAAENAARESEQQNASETRRLENEAREATLRAENAERDAKAKIELEKQIADAETARREADTKHRATVNGEILAACVAEGVASDQATLMMKAVIAGKIPHVRINY